MVFPWSWVAVWRAFSAALLALSLFLAFLAAARLSRFSGSSELGYVVELAPFLPSSLNFSAVKSIILFFPSSFKSFSSPNSSRRLKMLIQNLHYPKWLPAYFDVSCIYLGGDVVERAISLLYLFTAPISITTADQSLCLAHHSRCITKGSSSHSFLLLVSRR